MATVGEAIAATLIAQWSGLGGAQPDPIQYLVERPERDPNPTVADAVYVWLPLRRRFTSVGVGGGFRNVTYTVRVVCHTKTSSARQLEIENEVDRILNSGTPITGATTQTVKEINDISNRSYSKLPKYISEVIVEVFTAMEVSATAYGTATATTITVDELTVNTSIAGNPTAALGNTRVTNYLGVGILPSTDYGIYSSNDGTKPQLALRDAATGVIWRFTELAGTLSIDPVSGTDRVIDVKNTGAGDADIHIDSLSLRSLLMLGSANAAWVQCSYAGCTNGSFEAGIATGTLTNTGASAPDYINLTLPLPTAKGGLKLYVSGTKIGILDADAAAYIDLTYVRGYLSSVPTNLDIDTTNKNSLGEKTDTWTAVDCSPYRAINVMLSCVTDVANELDIYYVAVQCYYDV